MASSNFILKTRTIARPQGEPLHDYYLPVNLRGKEFEIHFTPKDASRDGWKACSISFDETGKVPTYLVLENDVMTDSKGRNRAYVKYFASLTIDGVEYRSQFVPKGTSDKDLLTIYLNELSNKQTKKD